MPVRSVARSAVQAGKLERFADLVESVSGGARTRTGVPAVDRLLSGGLVAGSVTLLGGEPGIGKSTLLAQVALRMAETGGAVVYVTGEESPAQVAMRFRRLAASIPASLQFLDTVDASVIAATIEKLKPVLVIVDSVQSLRLEDAAGEAGSVSQVRASSGTVSEAAKRSGVPIFLVGQVTKDGDLAGPRLLEHLVDTVFMMNGDRDQSFRTLYALKHRFGSTDEIAVFSMGEKGMEEVLDPSSALVADRPHHASGSIVTCLAQGTRPLLVEIQALVTPAGYGTPIRRAHGIDASRLPLLLAVLGRHVGIPFHDQDVFVNAVGGVEARDASVDLAICLALVSAKKNHAIAPGAASWGEVGLSGEVRPVARAASRLKEADRLGFSSLYVPRERGAHDSAKTIVCASIGEALKYAGLH